MTDRVVTIGYDGRTPEELASELKRRRVRVVVDVRLTPMSRKPGMSKRRLAETVEAAGMSYVHLPALGMPRDNRDAFHRRDPAAIERMRQRLHTAEADRALDEVITDADRGRVALLCIERDPSICHRRLVAEAITGRRPDLGVVDVP